uniref:Phage terminase, large subunit n=1 Tax=Haliea sp. ETY-M TaxID=1055105 RepID=A0A455R328_9GAMM|nr:phage terminase, large subunit [Haliea sp. ETY-M]
MMMCPEIFDLFLGGGRGGGKSFSLVLLALRHVEQYQERARILYVRRSYKAVADFELLTREVFGQVYGGAARYNSTDHVWRFPSGAFMELSQLESPADYSKFQGRSFSLLLIDEAGEYPSPADLDRLRSNLRGPKNVPIRTVMAANPGGVGHAWLSKRYVFRDAPWHPFAEESSGREWIYAPSTFLDNPELDQEQYQAQLRASCPTDAELLRAWMTGDWAIARGAYFGSVIEEARNAIDPWRHLLDTNVRWDYEGPRWRYYLAHDYGSSAPSVTYLVADSPGAEGPDGRFYPPNSLVLVDELATVDPDDPTVGMGYTVPRLADEIKSFCKRWGIRPEGVADDAIFSDHGSQAGTIAEEFRRAGVTFRRARKGDRIAGWETMRRLLSDAGKPDVSGLYVTRMCRYWWETVPYLGRDPRRVEDVDTRGPDHAADACRYACTAPAPPAMSIKMGMAM